MKRKHVVLEVLPGRIDVVALEGARRVASRSLAIEAHDDPCDWAKEVRRASSSLRAAVEDLGVTGCEATVLYRSPTQSVDMSGYAVRSPAQAIEAARMSCMDALPYSTMSAVCEATPLGRDAAGEARQTHVLATAEREDVADAMASMVAEAGLRLSSATPLDAAVIAQFAAGALREKGTHASLYIGDHMSFFVVVTGETMLFSRRIDLGIEALVTSLTRPIVRSGSEPIELSRTEARGLLERFGIPGRDTIVDESRGLTGTQVVPLMQPVLQRFIVELRQSLRFGVDEQYRDGLSIRVTGPGSALAGMTSLIGNELGVETTGDTAYVARDGATPTDELSDALREPRFLHKLNLLPRELSRARAIGRLRRWLWTGAAAAIAFIGADAFRYHVRLEAAEGEARAYAFQIQDLASLEQTSAQLLAVMEARRAVDATLAKEIGSSVNLRACLQELSRITPETIRFTTVRFTRAADGGEGRLTGIAMGSEAGRTELEPFIDAMRGSPLFDDVELGNVQIASGEKQQFQASFTAHAVPRTFASAAPDVAAPDVVASAEEGAPE